jgi:hypothetical protein
MKTPSDSSAYANIDGYTTNLTSGSVHSEARSQRSEVGGQWLEVGSKACADESADRAACRGAVRMLDEATFKNCYKGGCVYHKLRHHVKEWLQGVML